jgi:hypothetical protein
MSGLLGGVVSRKVSSMFSTDGLFAVSGYTIAGNGNSGNQVKSIAEQVGRKLLLFKSSL